MKIPPHNVVAKYERVLTGTIVGYTHGIGYFVFTIQVDGRKYASKFTVKNHNLWKFVTYALGAKCSPIQDRILNLPIAFIETKVLFNNRITRTYRSNPIAIGE